MTTRRPPPPHGTRARYVHAANPCRCASCRAANAAYIRTNRDHARGRRMG